MPKRYTKTDTPSQEQIMIEQIAIAGEYPQSNQSRIISSESYGRRLIAGLLGEKMITRVDIDGMKGYRLTMWGKRALMDGNPERFDGLFIGQSDTNRMNGNPTRRERLHLIAQVYTLMFKAGIRIYQDEKPDIYGEPGGTQGFAFEGVCFSKTDAFEGKCSSQTDAFEGRCSPQTDMGSMSHTNPAHPPPRYEHGGNPEAMKSVVIREPSFYASREQKGNFTKAIQGSRAVGVLLTGNLAYAIYNTSSAVRTWNDRIEYRYKAEMNGSICKYIPQYQRTEIGGILVGANMGVLAKYLAQPEKEKGGIHSFTRAYEPFYYITNDVVGEAQLRMICDPELKTRFDGMMRHKLKPMTTRSNIVHDAMTDEGEPVLFCCLLDLQRLNMFKAGLNGIRKIDPDRKGKIICYDTQHDTLKGYLGESVVEYTVVAFHLFAQRFFPELSVPKFTNGGNLEDEGGEG